MPAAQRHSKKGRRTDLCKGQPVRDCPQVPEGIDGRRLCRARAVNCAPVFRVEFLRGKPDQAQRTGTCGQLPNSISLVSLAFELASLQPPDRQHLSGTGRFCQHTTPEASGARRRQGLKPEGARPGEAAGSTHSAKARRPLGRDAENQTGFRPKTRLIKPSRETILTGLP